MSKSGTLYHSAAMLPLASFDPRYKELLLRGAQAEFSVDCQSLPEARNLRARIHTYRSQAKKHFGAAQSAEWEPLYLCTIYLEHGIDYTRLRFAPRHKEFENVLNQVPGLKAPPLVGGDSLLDKLSLEQEANPKPERDQP